VDVLQCALNIAKPRLFILVINPRGCTGRG
jgi:hypothetical protein